MKRAIIIGTVLLIYINPANAQEIWKNDFEEAKTEAYNENNNILLLFSGSDWCAPCIRLKKEILSTSEFNAFAEQNLVLIETDFPRKKQNRLSKMQQDKNEQLAEKYNKEGHFPLVVMLDKNGAVLGKLGYERITVQQYIQKLSSF